MKRKLLFLLALFVLLPSLIKAQGQTTPVRNGPGLPGCDANTNNQSIYLLTATGQPGLWECLNGAWTFVGTGSGGGGVNDPGSNGIMSRTALNTTVARTLTGTANKITVTNGDGTAGNPTFTVGTDIVDKTATNTFGAAGTVDLSGATSASALRVPNIAGASTTVAGAMNYDTTNKNIHMGANGVDNINIVMPSSVSPANGDCAKFSVVAGVITLNTQGAACGSAAGLGDPGGNGVVVRTALNVTTARTITGTSGKIVLTNGDGVAGNPTINVGADIVDETIANVFASGGSLDLSAVSSAGGFRVPNIVGASSTTAGAISYDTTNNNFHAGGNSADNIVAIIPSSITVTNGHLATWSLVGGVLTLTDGGTAGAGTVTNTAGALTSGKVVLGNGGSDIKIDANFDDGVTTASTLTYAGTGGVSATQFTTTGTGPFSMVGNTGTCTASPASQGKICFSSTGNRPTYSYNAGSATNIVLATDQIVTSVALTAPSWLSVAGSPITSSGTLAITAATGQTSHQVIGTCGAATSFGPCALVAADLPAVPLSGLATQAADTVVMNATGSTAVPTAVAIPSCSTGTSALIYNTSTHSWGCNSITGSGGSSVSSYPFSYQTRVESIGLSFTNSSGITVANTNSATTIVGSTFSGRNVLLAGSMLPGTSGMKTMKVHASGVLSTAASPPTLTVTISLGGVTLSAISVPVTGSLSGVGWELDYYFTVNGLTSANVGGRFEFLSSTGAVTAGSASSANVTGLNFAADQTFDVKVTWGTASSSNTLTANQLVLYPDHRI